MARQAEVTQVERDEAAGGARPFRDGGRGERVGFLGLLSAAVGFGPKGEDWQERKDLQEAVEDAIRDLGPRFRVHSNRGFSPMVFGQSDDAAMELSAFLCVDSAEHRKNLSGGEYSILSEIEQMVADVRKGVAGTEASVSDNKPEKTLDEQFKQCLNDVLTEAGGMGRQITEAEMILLEQADQLEECLHYVLYEEAGSSDVVFDNGGLKRDCDHQGRLLPSREIVDPVTGDKRSMRLDDFVNHPSARLAGLRREHVLALRLYTTIAFKSINGPLRDFRRREEGRAHPLPVTVTLIGEALRQLRKVEGRAATAQESVDLYRGLGGRIVQDEFLAKGGTEIAPMSTTKDLRLALQYSASEHAVVLRFRTKNFMERGSDIAFVSAFPSPSEMAFPPLTYLVPVRAKDKNGVLQPKMPQVIKVGGAEWTFVDVQAQF